MSGKIRFNSWPTPVTVPPVPTPETNASKPRLPKTSTISFPVFCSCTIGLAGLLNCKGMKYPCSSANAVAFAIAPFIPSAPGVNNKSAPYACINLRRSILIVSGITILTGYPNAAPTIANPMPVLPLVGSIIVCPGFRRPSASACWIMLKAIRSFTLPPGLKNSSLTKTSAAPSGTIRFNFTTGL